VDVNFPLNQASRALWIGNVSDDVDEEYLLREFEAFGEIESVRLLREKTCAFVNFVHMNDAVNALHALQGKKFGSMTIRINFGKVLLNQHFTSSPNSCIVFFFAAASGQQEPQPRRGSRV
jgi:RNA recognition motif-containing protein